jgi:hypothetical protein
VFRVIIFIYLKFIIKHAITQNNWTIKHKLTCLATAKIYSVHSSDPDFIQIALQDYEVLSIDPGEGEDGGVGTSTVPPLPHIPQVCVSTM